MNISFLPIVTTFILCYLLILILYPYAIKIDLIDVPSKRKHHRGDIPLIGGVSMFVAVIVGILLSPLDISQYKYHFISCIILVFMGALDDYKGLSVQIRLFLQIIAILVITEFAGNNLLTLGNLAGNGEVLLTHWSTPFTVLAIVGVINSLNMIDGIDGLAGSISLSTFLSIGCLSYMAGNEHYLTLALIFSAALISFLIHNLVFKTKKIFMGDAGSMFLGLGISLLLIKLTQGENKIFAPVTALWLFALPLIDTFAIVLRRMKNNDSPFKADRNHIHHIFIRIGFSDRQALFLLTIISICMACVGIWSEVEQIEQWKMFVMFVVISTMYFVGLLYIWKIISFLRKLKSFF